jgi:hypothetical protein
MVKLRFGLLFFFQTSAQYRLLMLALRWVLHIFPTTKSKLFHILARFRLPTLGFTYQSYFLISTFLNFGPISFTKVGTTLGFTYWSYIKNLTY